MIHLFPVLFLGCFILVLLLWVLSRSRGQETENRVTIEQFTQAQETLSSFLADFYSLKQIFDAKDMDWISTQIPRTLCRQFVKDRTEAALDGIREFRREVGQLVDLHFRLASYTYEPAVKFEFKLALDYVSFIAVCRLLEVLIRLRGPFEVGKLVNYSTTAANRLCSMFSMRLEKINPTLLGSAKRSQTA